jgi:hypothetical protein
MLKDVEALRIHIRAQDRMVEDFGGLDRLDEKGVVMRIYTV